jgi:hypothetical protein
MDTNLITARIAAPEPVSAPIGLRLSEEAQGRATAVAVRNGHVLLQYYFASGGRTVILQSDEGARTARISGTQWKPQGRLWLLDLDQAA